MATIQPGITLLSDKIKDELRELAHAVVGINTKVTYKIYTYNYIKINGEFVPDPEGPLKYKLASNYGNLGIDVEEDNKTLLGSGLILDLNHERAAYTILTNNHLVAPQEITNVYYPDEEGLDTDILFARYVVQKVEIAVRGNNNWLSKAELIAKDAKNDLAIIKVETSDILGREYKNNVDYDLNLSWGDWVFLFGFPKGIKQLTGGWVSEAPYSNTLAVDAVVRFGYSGGPVFAVSQDNPELLFVGMIKSVPRSTLDYIAPDESWPIGFRFSPDENNNMTVRREFLVEYGTAYFVKSKTIQKFINTAKSKLDKAGIFINSKYYDN